MVINKMLGRVKASGVFVIYPIQNYKMKFINRGFQKFEIA